MPNVKVFDMAGKEVGDIALSDVIFGAEVNGAVLHAAVRAYLLNQRQGTQSTLTRTEVSGGGRKPWRQKGTGRARQGSTRSPQWTHGGVALGPKPRDYRTDLNKKTKRVALYSALSAKVAAGDLVVVDAIKTEGYSTKTMVNMLKALGAEKKALVVLPAVDAAVIKSCANIPGVVTTQFNTVNVYDVLNADKFIIAKDAVAKLEEVYA
ncbi:MAG: 50S ribosomal protein L4 [Ruminococcaceae bacterium]|nr:50S ribosomal protein L4 [Oscillospiraceae bacterium]